MDGNLHMIYSILKTFLLKKKQVLQMAYCLMDMGEDSTKDYA